MGTFDRGKAFKNGSSFQVIVQIGTYSPSSQVVGIQTHNITASILVPAAVIAGDKERKFEPITIPKVVKGLILLPGFLPVVPMDTVRYYAGIVWKNDNTFMEGCSMALRLRKKGTDQGFMWAFSCPRFSNNKQAAKNGLSDPEKYYDDLEWNENPEKFTISTTDAKIPVTCSVNALSGAKDNLYEVYIQIGNDGTASDLI